MDSTLTTHFGYFLIVFHFITIHLLTLHISIINILYLLHICILIVFIGISNMMMSIFVLHRNRRHSLNLQIL